MISVWPATRELSVNRLRGEVDRALNEAVGGMLGERPWLWRRRLSGRSFPAVNVWEKDETLFAEAEVPGLKMEDLDISVTSDQLSIKGERMQEEQEGVTYHRRERGAGSFCGVVHLPVEVDVEKVEARLEGGVLTVALPKAARAKPRKIEVRALNS
jgi:HSP20 family protein